MLHIPKKYSHITGEISLIIWIFLGSFMGVIVRFLNEYFATFEQIFLRSFFALLFILTIYLFSGKLKFHNYSKSDLFIIILRSLIILGAIASFVLAITYTTLANVGFISAIPSTAIIGAIFLKEKISFKKISYLGISFLGVCTILIKDLESLQIGIGELYALIGAFLFSIGLLLRKKLSDHLGDKEISFLNIFLTVIFTFTISLLFEGNIYGMVNNISLDSSFYVFLGALTFIGISYFSIYGFKRVNAITASSIEFLEVIFSIIFGYFIFSEIPSIYDFIGGILIIVGAYGIMKLNVKKA